MMYFIPNESPLKVGFMCITASLYNEYGPDNNGILGIMAGYFHG